MTKKVSIIGTRRSKLIAKLYELRILADYIREDLNCERVQIYSSSDIEKAYLRPIRCSEEFRDVDINELVNKLDLLHWNSNNLFISYNSLHSPIYNLRDLSTDEILHRISQEIINDFKENFRSFIYETHDTEIEYLFILIRSGEWLILEGDIHRVSIPRINNVIASIHTHPASSCIPSRTDLETMIDLLTSGGVLFGVASRSCLFSAELTNFVSEFTYEKLMHFLNNYDKFVQFIMRNLGGLIRIGDDLIFRVRYEI
ncbi:MAG: hypothetical protein ACP5I7_05825 [Sulfolobales archaeon]